MDKFTRMIMGARKADTDSIRELKNYIYEKSGVANRNLRALEKAGLTEYAYGRAYTFLNTEYQSIKYPQIGGQPPKFPQAVAHRTTESLIKQALELHRFLSSKTHTVSGAKKAKQAQIEGIQALNKLGYNIPTDSERIARAIRVLGNDGLKFDDSYKYILIETIDQAFEQGATDFEVQLTIDRYASGELLYNEMLEELNHSTNQTYRLQ